MQNLTSHVVYCYAVVGVCLMGLVAYVRFQKKLTKKILTRYLAHESHSKIKV